MNVHLPCFSGLSRISLLSVLILLTVAFTAEVQGDTSTALSDRTLADLPAFPPISDFDVITEKPLFNNSRRPVEESSAPTGGDAQALRTDWKLTGVSITPERSLALFEERKGSQRLRLEVGMLLDGRWQLDEINADAVSVISGDQVVRLELRQPRETKARAKASREESKPGSPDSNSTATNGIQEPTTSIPNDRSRQKRSM